jgi:hypothetical protein
MAHLIQFEKQMAKIDSGQLLEKEHRVLIAFLIATNRLPARNWSAMCSMMNQNAMPATIPTTAKIAGEPITCAKRCPIISPSSKSGNRPAKHPESIESMITESCNRSAHLQLNIDAAFSSNHP